MKDEGYIAFNSRRYGLLAALRRKQWWYFEGLDPDQRLYFVFLALEAFPTSYVSMKLIDYGNNRRWTEDHLGGFQSDPGDAVKVAAAGNWGHLRFSGRAEEGWDIDIQTPHVSARCVQTPEAPVHRNWLQTQHIDYTIQQFVMNQVQGNVALDGEVIQVNGYGYHEHNWGLQPRHSTAHWLHFWSPQTAGVVLSCHYDAGVPHHYTYLWHQGSSHYLYSPANFSFDPASPEAPHRAESPDMSLDLRPITAHHTRMRIPPLLGYIDVDYFEQLLEVQGRVVLEGQPLEIQGVGKLDYNWNRW
jgi:hypothetical protein